MMTNIIPKPFLLVALLSGLTAPLLPAGAQEPRDSPLPPPEEILMRYLDKVKDRDEEEILRRYSFRRSTVVEKLDNDGTPEERTEYLHDIGPVEDALFARLIEKDGEPLSDQERRKESQRIEKFRRKRREALRKHEKRKPPDDDLEINQALIGRYTWKVTGVELVNGRAAYVLSFEPRSGKLPAKKRMDHALNKAAGTVWVDAAESELVRIRVHLTEEIKFWGGLLGRISAFALQVENVRTEEGDWLLSVEKVYVRGRVFLRSMHVRTNRHSTGFRRTSPLAQPAASRQP